jgi:streptomycin 6-kinase
MPAVFAVPAVVRNKARAVGADAWLRDLPDLVASICVEWEIVVGETYDDATEAYVAAATLADGTPAVLKLIVPRDGAAAAHEATVLRLADGAGCPLLLRADVGRGALLLERLGTPLARLDWPLTARHEALCAAAARMWRPAPDAELPTGAEKGRWLVDFITTAWEELDRPCSERAVAHAVDCAGRRIAAHDDERAFLVHGDVHQWNALQSDDGFKLVDPDGLRCEREYDLGILMREDPLELMDGDDRPRAAWLAERTGLDAQAIRQWGVVERVSTGLLATRVDLQPAGRDMLRAADAIARHQYC